MEFGPTEVMAALPFLSREASLELQNIMLERRLEEQTGQKRGEVSEDDPVSD